VNDAVRVACVQAEPVIFDRARTIEKLAALTRDAAAERAQIVLFPETFVPVYPSNRWARHLAHGSDGTKLFARLLEQSVEVPGPHAAALAAVAREHGIWLAVGVNERERGTIYNALLLFAPNGRLALHHRKLIPTNHERLVWGQGDGRGLETVDIGAARVGGLICWENMMPLARFALYERGVELYLAPTADDSEEWHYSIRHIAREARAFVVSSSTFQRASSYPPDVPLADGAELLGRGGSAIVAPDGSYLAGPLWDEEGILYADLDPGVLHAARQRFDPAGHYHRPDVFSLDVTPHS
jgi:nitrilase